MNNKAKKAVKELGEMMDSYSVPDLFEEWVNDYDDETIRKALYRLLNPIVQVEGGVVTDVIGPSNYVLADKDIPEEKTIHLVASGYAWTCPTCGQVNTTPETEEIVYCPLCGMEFNTCILHAIGGGS